VLRRFSHLSVLLVFMVIVIALMGLLNGKNFLSIGNFQSMAYQMPELGILTLAMMITMLTSGINLSIIASANLAGIMMAMVLTRAFPPESANSFGVILLAMLVGLLTSAVIGALNGVLIAYLDISPILATLGTMIMISGFAVVLTEGYVISGLPENWRIIGNNAVLGIPIPIIIFAACAGFMALLLNRTPFGKQVYLIGSNPTACTFSGVNNRAVLFYTYMISGIFSGIASMVMISRFNSAKADYGESYLLLTILSAVLGGVDAAGGFGKVSGVVVSLIILQMISSGLNLLGISNFFTLALWGIVLILVMVIKYLIDSYVQKRQLA